MFVTLIFFKYHINLDIGIDTIYLSYLNLINHRYLSSFQIQQLFLPRIIDLQDSLYHLKVLNFRRLLIRNQNCLKYYYLRHKSQPWLLEEGFQNLTFWQLHPCYYPSCHIMKVLKAIKVDLYFPYIFAKCGKLYLINTFHYLRLNGQNKQDYELVILI